MLAQKKTQNYYISSMTEVPQTLLQSEINKAVKYINNIFKTNNIEVPSLQKIWDSADYAIECSRVFYFESGTFLKTYSHEPALGWYLLFFKGNIWILLSPEIPTISNQTYKNIDKDYTGTRSSIETFICDTQEQEIYNILNSEFFKIR